MKEAEDYWKDMEVLSFDNAMKMIEQIQIDAYNKALEDAAENVKLNVDGKLHGDEYFVEKYDSFYSGTLIDVNKDLILELKK